MMMSGSLDSLTPLLPNSSSSSLEKYLQEHLKIPHDKGRLSCYVLSDHYVESDWALESRPSAFISATEYLKTRHLILVSQCYLGSPEKKKFESPCLVLGMSVIEYAYSMMTDRPGIPSRAYIQYVDSTGMMRPRNLQGVLSRKLVECYIKYARDILKVNFIHLFASPKPSLLFAGSEVIGKKTVHGGRHLISWWLALLNHSLADYPINTLIYAFGPGEELLPLSTRHTQHCIEKLSRRVPAPFFIYGFPYKLDDPVQDHIPTFEDDPKFRHMEALLGCKNQEDRPRKRQRREQPHLTVREFLETLSYRSDFSQDHSALICVHFEQPCQSLMEIDQIQRSETASCILKMLKTLAFDSEAEALRSSAKVLALTRIVGVLGFPIESDCDQENFISSQNGSPKAICRFKEILHLLQPQSSPCLKTDDHRVAAPIIDLTGSIRRKLPRACN